MEVEDYLKILQSQYPGRLVLYSDDIAQVLGKTKRSLDGLIARGALPFRIKKLNGRWCTGILDVAVWLSSDDQPESAVPSNEPPRKKRVSSVAPATSPRERVSFAAQLRKMRIARTFQPFCTKLSLIDSDDDREFVAEMLQSALPSSILMPKQFVETDPWFRVEECDLVDHRLLVRRVSHHGGHFSITNFRTFTSDSAAALITSNLGRVVTGHAYRVGRMEWVFSGHMLQAQG